MPRANPRPAVRMLRGGHQSDEDLNKEPRKAGKRQGKKGGTDDFRIGRILSPLVFFLLSWVLILFLIGLSHLANMQSATRKAGKQQRMQ